MIWWLGVIVLALLSAAVARRMWQDVPTDPSTYELASFAAWAGLTVVLAVLAVVIPLRRLRRGRGSW